MDLAQAPQLARDIADNARSPLTDPPGTPGSTPSPRPSGGFPGSGSPTSSPTGTPAPVTDDGYRRGRPMVVRTWIVDPGQPPWVADERTLGAPISWELYGREPISSTFERLGLRVFHTREENGQIVDAVYDPGRGRSPVSRGYFVTAHPLGSEPPPVPEPAPGPNDPPQGRQPRNPGDRAAPPVGSPPPTGRPTPDRPNSPQTPGSPTNPSHPSPPALPFPPFVPMPAPAQQPGARPNSPPRPQPPLPVPVSQGVPSAQGTPAGSASSFGQPRTSTITGGGSPVIPQPPTPNLQCRYSPHLDEQIAVLSNVISNVQLLEVNNKLGPQLSNGGISGFLKRFANSSLIQGAASVANRFATLHNAFMLSNNLRMTLFSMFDVIYQAPFMQQFAPKDPETGQTISYEEFAGNTAEALMNQVFGEQTTDEIKEAWWKANRIYQATANLLFSIQSIAFSIQEALEVIGQWVASIGNALKRAGVVFEKAYAWMNPTPDFSNKWFTRMEQAENLFNSISMVAGATREVADSVDNFQRSKTELDNALKDSEPGTLIPDNEPLKESEEESKQGSQGVDIDNDDLTRPEPE